MIFTMRFSLPVSRSRRKAAGNCSSFPCSSRIPELIVFVKPLLKIACCEIHEFAFERTVDEDVPDADLPQVIDENSEVSDELLPGLDGPRLAGCAHDEVRAFQLTERQFIVAGRQ